MDDIVERLRRRAESWEHDGELAPDCVDAQWDREGADEIERLRSLSDQLAEALDVQCGLHRIPVTTTPYYTQHAKDALQAYEKVRCVEG